VELLSLVPSLLLVQLFRRIRQRKVTPMHHTIFNVSENKRKRCQITFPWWCIFLAYGLSILLVGVSILLIIARGIQLGDLTTQKWLTSIVIGFFSSVCLSQPLKVCHFVDKELLIY
jgi:hypothetical protein